MVLTKRIATFILILILNRLDAQKTIDSFTFSIDSSLLNLKVDKLQNIWRIYPSVIIRESDDKAYRDSFRYEYDAENVTIDLRYSLKNLFYSRRLNSIKLLNSRWGILSQLYLDRIGIYQPSFVKFSSDENFWTLDYTTNQLYKINESGIKKYEIANPFRLGDKLFYPSDIIDYKSQLVALDTAYGLFILDDYGNVTQTFPISGVKNIFQFNEHLLVYQNQSLILFEYDKQSKLWNANKKSLIIPPIRSLEGLKNEAFILFENKRLYRIPNFISLFGD